MPYEADLLLVNANVLTIDPGRPKAGAVAVSGGRVAVMSLPGAVAVEGGLPLLSGGECIGAIGVSGVTSEQDAQIGAAGAALLN